MMNLTLTNHGAQLLPTQLALNGTFEHRLVTRGLAGQLENIVPVKLQVDQCEHEVHLELRMGHQHHSGTLPKADPRKLAISVQQWIEDCANARVEHAS